MSLSVRRIPAWTVDEANPTGALFGGGFERAPPKGYLWQLTRFMQLSTGRELQATLQKRIRQRVVYFDEWVRLRQFNGLHRLVQDTHGQHGSGSSGGCDGQTATPTSSLIRDDIRLHGSPGSSVSSAGPGASSSSGGDSVAARYLYYHTFTGTWAEQLPVFSPSRRGDRPGEAPRRRSSLEAQILELQRQHQRKHSRKTGSTGADHRRRKTSSTSRTESRRQDGAESKQGEKKKTRQSLKPAVPKQKHARKRSKSTKDSHGNSRYKHHHSRGSSLGFSSGGGFGGAALRRFSIIPFELWCVLRVQRYWRNRQRRLQRRVIALNLIKAVLIPCALAKVSRGFCWFLENRAQADRLFVWLFPETHHSHTYTDTHSHSHDARSVVLGGGAREHGFPNGLQFVLHCLPPSRSVALVV